MRKYILIVNDGHPSRKQELDPLCDLILANGKVPIMFEPNNSGHELSLNISDTEVAGGVHIKSSYYPFSQILTVFDRYGLHSMLTWENPDDKLRSDFCQKEWNSLLASLPFCFKEIQFVNPRVNPAEYKTAQLKLASELGLRIPSTCLTNSPVAILKHYEQCPEVIFKTFHTYSIPEGQTFTTKITKKFIEENADSVKHSPGIYQECVKRKYDLRINVIGNNVVCTKISFPLEKTIDWRELAVEDCVFEAIKLPLEFEKKLIALNSRFGILYGAYDFLVVDEGEPVFLECNTIGSWMFVERRSKQNITQTIANLLCQGKQ